MRSDWKQNIVRNFGAQAGDYDQYSALQKDVAQSLADELPELETPDVLEIGCGTGAMTRHLLKRYPAGNFQITDISADMLAAHRAQFEGQGDIVWDVMDGEHPDERAQSYDLIVGNMVFQWFEDLDAALERLRRLLKPEGALLYSLPSPESFKEWRAALSALSLPAGTLQFDVPDSVFKAEDKPRDYGCTLDFLRSLKGIGAVQPRRGYAALSRQDLLKACHAADETSHGRITWHILYGRIESAGGGA